MSRAPSLLLDTARRGELHHAIILHGPSREALRLLANRLAKTLNCLQGSTGGDDCAICTRIDRGIHPDVQIVSTAEEKTRISVEQARAVIGEATFRPFEGRTKVFIFDGAEMMNPSAANALLKTLEEPTRDTIFLLLTRSPEILPITIRSRSHSIFIPPHDTTPAREVARRTALPLQVARLRQIEGVERQDVLAESIIEGLHRALVEGEMAALLSVAALIVSEDEVQDRMGLLATVLRDLAAVPPEESVDPGKVAAIQSRIPQRTLLESAEDVIRAMDRLIVNADPRLLVEQALIRLAHR